MAVLSGCTPGAKEHSSPTQFFQNSMRRNATESEKSQVVKVGGCTAFFVENTRGLALMISARHCFQYKATDWCAGGGSIADNANGRGSCQELVAGDSTHDIVLFRVNMPYVPNATQTLRLADFTPAVNTRLKMIGYPGDRLRNGALTVTESCWVMTGEVPSPHTSRLGISDVSVRHNCTTYGGNSGGPMIVEGTRVAIGLPFTYQPNDYEERSATEIWSAAHLALMSGFVANNRAKLVELGVVLASSASDADVQNGGPQPNPSPAPNPTPQPNGGGSSSGNNGGSGTGGGNSPCTCSVDNTGSLCGLFQNGAAVAWSQIDSCNQSLCQQLFASSIASRCGGTFTMGQGR